MAEIGGADLKVWWGGLQPANEAWLRKTGRLNPAPPGRAQIRAMAEIGGAGFSPPKLHG